MQFRLDIQLLRAFAVIVVVLYHLQVPFFGKGFLGVDVFFVISGFLMAVLYKQGQPIEFMKRRIRRLLPPYFAVLITTLLVGLILLMPNELSQLIKQSVYSLFFAANIGFWSENSYFSSSGFKPLLHLWSLGVEVQYYLFVPLLMWVFRKYKLSIFVIGLGSLASCILMLYISPKTSFFMMPFRVWEFLIGAAAAIYLTDKGNVRNAPKRWIGLLGAAALVSIQFLPVNGQHLGFISGHPGFSALLTCLATLVILTYGLPTKTTNSNLAKPFVYIGKISYSIYLVHFPIIVFYFYEPFSGTILSEGSVYDTAILLILIAALSLACYYLVEKPAPKINQVALAASASLAVAITTFAGSAIIEKKFSTNELGYLLANEDRAPYRCGKLNRILAPSAKTCALSSDANLKDGVFLVGNSHADSIKIAFKNAATTHGYQTYFSVENTPLMPGGASPQEIINQAKELGVSKIVTHHSMAAVSENAYLQLYEGALKSGIDLIVIAPIPAYQQSIPQLLYQNHTENGFNIKLQDHAVHLKEARAGLEPLIKLNEANADRFLLLDSSEYFCNPECNVVGEDGKAWYFDDDHLTLTGAEQLSPLFHRIFQAE